MCSSPPYSGFSGQVSAYIFGPARFGLEIYRSRTLSSWAKKSNLKTNSNLCIRAFNILDFFGPAHFANYVSFLNININIVIFFVKKKTVLIALFLLSTNYTSIMTKRGYYKWLSQNRTSVLMPYIYISHFDTGSL